MKIIHVKLYWPYCSISIPHLLRRTLVLLNKKRQTQQ